MFVASLKKLQGAKSMIQQQPMTPYEKREQHYLLTDESGDIFNITEGLTHCLGLHPKIFDSSRDVFANTINFEAICPEASEPDIQWSME